MLIDSDEELASISIYFDKPADSSVCSSSVGKPGNISPCKPHAKTCDTTYAVKWPLVDAKPREASESDGDEIIPTQPMEDKPLKGVIAFVDVRSKDENCKDGVIKQLKHLGAEVSDQYSKETTHVVFKNGRNSTLTRAFKRKLQVVSVLWIDNCLATWKRVEESLYPVKESAQTDNGTPKSAKLRRIKSMQPKPFETDLSHSNKKLEKRLLSNDDSAQRNRLSEYSFEDEPHQLSTPDCIPDSSFYHCIAKRRAASKRDNSVNNGGDGSPILSESPSLLETPDCNVPSGYTGLEQGSFCIGKSPSEQRKTSTSGSPQRTSLGLHGSGNENNAVSDVSQERDCAAVSPLVENNQPIKRRRTSSCRKQRNHTLVMTSLHHSERKFTSSVASRLGSFRIADRVTTGTSHVICGEPRRTLNVLLALVRGCWILSPAWISDSFEVGHWVDEADYEIKDAFPMACKSHAFHGGNRKRLYSDLLSCVPTMYVSETTRPSCKDLTTLISLCGGKTTKTVRHAGLLIGAVQGNRQLQYVKEEWLLDSIMQCKVLPVASYTQGSNDTPRPTASPEY